MAIAKTKEGKPYIRVLLTEDLEARLEEWKAQTGSNHSDTIRVALNLYLSDKVESRPPRPKNEVIPIEASPSYKPNKKADIDQVRDALKEHYKTLLDQLRHKYTSEWKKVNRELDADIAKNVEQFNTAGLSPSSNAVIDILLMDKTTTTGLRDYLKMLKEPPGRTHNKQ